MKRMKRRKFVSTAGLGALGAGITLKNALANKSILTGMKKLTAEDVNKYLRSLIDVEEPSVDKIIIGDPETPVNKIGTAWMPYWKTCKQAVKEGVNVLIVHEPTFYAHRDLEAEEWINIENPSTGQQKYLELRDEKASWILKNGLVIIRCHDVWDKIPDIGIPYAFGQALGYTNDDIIRRETFYNVYKTEPAPAIEMARSIASKLNIAEQPGVAFYGDENYMVRSVGVGTGCICNPMNYMQLEPDLFIAIDDTVRTWIQTTYAEDTGKPLVVVNHGTSEEFGIKLLGNHLAEAFQDYEVKHYKQGCTYKWITG
jgi:putative NIF3 family GTP cyclohydrolase 1 type 2